MGGEIESLGGGVLAMTIESDEDNFGKLTSPLPQDYLHDAILPDSFSWFDVDSEHTNLLNLVRQSNGPYRCDSCWAFAITEIISDRYNIMNWLAGNEQALEVNLSPQVLINAAELEGDCDGGYPGDAMKYLYDYGVPDETCQNYMAMNDPHKENPEYNVCYSCDHDGPCYEVKPEAIYKVQEYGYVSTVSNMKSEIYARGPIACNMYVDDGFQAYNGGIYSSSEVCDDCDGDDVDLNYMVAVVGWGSDEETGKEYWIGKNQWGIGWGINGYFKMEMGVNSNGIESDCIWGVPDYDNELELLTKRMNTLKKDVDKKKSDGGDYSFFSWLPRLGSLSMGRR